MNQPQLNNEVFLSTEPLVFKDLELGSYGKVQITLLGEYDAQVETLPGAFLTDRSNKKLTKFFTINRAAFYSVEGNDDWWLCTKNNFRFAYCDEKAQGLHDGNEIFTLPSPKLKLVIAEINRLIKSLLSPLVQARLSYLEAVSQVDSYSKDIQRHTRELEDSKVAFAAALGKKDFLASEIAKLLLSQSK